jgi:hypothetical protein
MPYTLISSSRAILFFFVSAASLLAQEPLRFTTNATFLAIPAGSPATLAVNVTGGAAPYLFRLASGTLPLGLTLDATTGVISGTPAAPGNPVINIKATDSSSPPKSVSKTFQLLVSPDAPKLSTTRPQPATVEAAYTHTFEATGGKPPYTWSTTSILPAGLTLNPATGVISGTPINTAAPTTAKEYVLSIRATGSNKQSAARNFYLTINPTPPPKIATQTLAPAAGLGDEYFGEITATGGKTPYKFTADTAPPAGLSLGTDGTLTSIPKTAGTFRFRVRVTGSDTKSSRATVTLVVSDAPSPKITTVSPLNGFVGSVFAHSLNATGGKEPYTWAKLEKWGSAV